MRYILMALLSLSLLSATSVDKKIKQNKKSLSVKKVEYKKMDKQLSSVAKKIIRAKKEQGGLSKKITTLQENINKNEVNYGVLKKKNETLSKEFTELSKVISDKKKKFLELVSKKFSMSLALEESNQPTSESVMMKEVYATYAKQNNIEMEKLEKEITILNQKKSTLNKEQSKIEKTILIYKKEREELASKKSKQDSIVKALVRDKAVYKKRFNKIINSRKKLEKKLASLKIIQHSEKEIKRIEKRNRKRALEAKEQAKLAQKKSTLKSVVVAPPVAPVIIESVPTEITNYRGGKTMSPLKGAILIKKFGTYVDPIYKFKIFNKSVTLKAPHSGSKVKNVLAGKIVFAENSGGMLGQVVIVEHKNKMHTIYAKLSRLAPGIHVGKKLSRGTVIGKVDNALMFEVTKNNKHMNPMKLIRL